MRIRLAVYMTLMIWTACAQKPPAEEQELRSWSDLCRQKIPGCELEGLDFSPYGEEICKCKNAPEPVHSNDGAPGDFHP